MTNSQELALTLAGKKYLIASLASCTFVILLANLDLRSISLEMNLCI